MRAADLRADEPFESRDLEIGAALRSWRPVRLEPELLGPLDAPGMDPTWILRCAGERVEIEVVVFYGPSVDITLVRNEIDLFIGGGRDLTPARMTAMLDELATVDDGAAVPTWMRPQPS